MKMPNVNDIYIELQHTYHPKDNTAAMFKMSLGVAEIKIASSDTYTHEVEVEITQAEFEEAIKKFILHKLWKEGNK